ncbi:MAG: HAD family phosphatase [Bacteroidota bacterium]
MKIVDTIVFDLGGVLIDWNPEYVFRGLIPNDEKRAWFFDNVCTSPWNVQQDAGYPLAQATADRIALFPEYEDLIRAYYGRWEEMLGGPIQASVDLFLGLKKAGKYPVFALTNWSAETFPVALERYAFLHEFEGILVSGEEKMIKPDLAIYRRFEAMFDKRPEQLFFVDDSAKNVAGAKSAGWQAAQVTTSEELAAALQPFLGT